MCKTNVQKTAESDFVPVIASVLNHLTQRNKEVSNANEKLKAFHSQRIPSINVADYLDRIVKYSYASQECFIFALVYLDRLVTKNPNCYITPYNVHRLLITSVLLAAKSRDDWYYSNAYYSTLGGVTNQELNKLEVTFLQLIDFELFISPTTFELYKNELVSRTKPTSTKKISKASKAAPTAMVEDEEPQVAPQVA